MWESLMVERSRQIVYAKKKETNMAEGRGRERGGIWSVDKNI